VSGSSGDEEANGQEIIEQTDFKREESKASIRNPRCEQM